MNRLETRLDRLVQQQILSAAQATELAEAARADQLDGRPEQQGIFSAIDPKGLCSLGGPRVRRRCSGAWRGAHARDVLLG